MSRYPISVVVPSIRGWPSMRLSTDSVWPQVSRAGGQLIIADASGLPIPPELENDDVVWMRMPGVAGYELRQAAYRRAEAPIVAITEDHCSVGDGWVAGIIAAHDADPEAAMIFGAVENGARAHLIDWALYFVGYGPWAPPLAADGRSNPGHANVSWKRWALDRLPAAGDKVMEFRYVAALRAAGERIVPNDELRVRHHQCDGVRPTSTLMFHNGRAIAGLRRDQMGLTDWLRTIAPPAVAGYRTLRTLATALSKPAGRGSALRSAPLIALLHLSHTLGESVGYLRGPGDSATRLH